MKNIYKLETIVVHKNTYFVLAKSKEDAVDIICSRDEQPAAESLFVQESAISVRPSDTDELYEFDTELDGSAPSLLIKDTPNQNEDTVARDVFKRMGTQLIMWEQKGESLYDIKLHNSSGLMFHPV